ncbi:MAG: hypothetical protein JXJ04_04400 [Spirochaetales bacterium]|nr:hypothetical protein [Spirochaetales bacterium]
MRKEIFTGIFFLGICLLFCFGCVSTPDKPAATDAPVQEEPTLEPTEEPTATPEPTEEPTVTPEPTAEPTEEPTKTPEPKKVTGPQVGEFWMEVPVKPVAPGAEFSTPIRINTGTQKIAAYGINISYDPAIIAIDVTKGSNGAEPGKDGYVAASNPTKPGVMYVAGFDVYGKGPGEALHMVTIYWKAVGKGTSAIEIMVKNLVDETIKPIGVQKGISSKVQVK